MDKSRFATIQKILKKYEGMCPQLINSSNDSQFDDKKVFYFLLGLEVLYPQTKNFWFVLYSMNVY